jgi:hypothetical protein
MASSSSMNVSGHYCRHSSHAGTLFANRSGKFSYLAIVVVGLWIGPVATGLAADEETKEIAGRVGAAHLDLGNIDPISTGPISTGTDIHAVRSSVNQLLAESWQQQGVTPARRSTDSEFIRRIYLDVLGRIPRVSEVRTFLDDPQRDPLILELLSRPGRATNLANVWRRFLLPEGTDLERLGGVAGFETWLRDRFAENMPYDLIVTELLLARGSPADSGPQLFYSAWELQPEKLTASTSRAFLGVQLQCAQCHDHPYQDWTQLDFWGYASFFARISNPTNSQAGTILGDFKEMGVGEVKLPDTDQVVPARYLGGELATAAETTRRQMLADWMVSPDNPFFARATVNRIWSHLFGRGLVDPPDDMGTHNPASHPEVLDTLSEYFKQSDYDIGKLIYLLTGTKAYQLSSASVSKEEDARALFQRMAMKSLTVEQLYDSLATATCRLQPAQLGGPTFGLNRVLDRGRQTFLSKMRAPSNDNTKYQSGILQALSLMNGELTEAATDWESSDIIQSLQAPFFTDAERITTLFLATLARNPRSNEQDTILAYVSGYDSQETRQRALGDVLWALLNSAEFTFNH